MHNKLSVTALAGVLALTTSGSDSTKNQLNLIAFSPKRLDLASPQKPATLVSNSQKPNLYPPGLIPSTNVDQRLKQVQYGRPDPFSGVLPQVEIAQKPQKVFPDLPELPTVKELPASPKPTPPNTDLAKGVAVEGVVQAGDESHAIIKLPQDSTSRYVSEGQQLPGGELLVKRIEFPPDSDPIVVLEQNGVEIALSVGEPASEQTVESTDIASSTGVSSDSDARESDARESDARESDSDSDASNSDSDSDARESLAGDEETAEPVETTQPIEEHIAAIPVPSPPPSSTSLKKSADVAAPPAPTNYKPSVDLAVLGEDYPSSKVLSSSNEVLVGSDLASSDRAGQVQAVDSQYTSRETGAENLPEVIASANVDDLTRKQELLERLRQSRQPSDGNRIESTKQATDGANVEANQDRSTDLSYKNPLLTDIPTIRDTKVMKVLSHRQELINQLRNTQALSTAH